MAALLQLTPGTVVGGDFRIVKPLSAGGMGALYVAEQASTGKTRALKVMHRQLVGDAKSRERFVQEARVGALIESDHVVEVIAAGVDDASGMPWIAMELLAGQDLSDFVTEHGALSSIELWEVLKQLCHALGAAHEAGVVHRDVKPENVFVARARSANAPTTVKVLDFGIAKVAAQAMMTATATVGSPAWMAPEQTKTKAVITPAADVWAVGLMAFWLLTGRCYWSAANDETSSIHALMRELLFDPITPASERAASYELGHQLPSGFDEWFARCVTRDPEDRYANASKLFEAFESMLTHAGFEPMPVSTPAPAAALGATRVLSSDVDPATPVPSDRISQTPERTSEAKRSSRPEVGQPSRLSRPTVRDDEPSEAEQTLASETSGAEDAPAPAPAVAPTTVETPAPSRDRPAEEPTQHEETAGGEDAALTAGSAGEKLSPPNAESAPEAGATEIPDEPQRPSSAAAGGETVPAAPRLPLSATRPMAPAHFSGTSSPTVTAPANEEAPRLPLRRNLGQLLGVLGFVVVVGIVIALVVRTVTEEGTAGTASATAELAALLPDPVEPASGGAAPAPAASPSAAATVRPQWARSTADGALLPAPSTSTHSTATSSASSAGPFATPPTASASAQPSAAPTGTPTTETAPPFDRAAAIASLERQAALARYRCRSAPGPRVVSASVVFGPAGKVIRVGLAHHDQRNDSTGACVGRLLRQARVRPFTGEPERLSVVVSLR